MAGFAHRCVVDAEVTYGQNALRTIAFPTAFTRPFSLADLVDGAAPFESGERLNGTRSERFLQLYKWLRQFPGYQAISDRASITSALGSFRRVQQKRRDDPKFSDGAADFRFWRCAALAVAAADLKYIRPPNADQRRKAVKAIDVLLKVDLEAAAFDVLESAGDEDRLIALLRTLRGSLTSVERRDRSDDFSSGREFVFNLASVLDDAFGYVSQAMVWQLASLHDRIPDQSTVEDIVKRMNRMHRSRKEV